MQVKFGNQLIECVLRLKPMNIRIIFPEIVANHLKNKDEIKICDPTSGSGSLLINIGQSISKYIDSKDNIKYYAQRLKKIHIIRYSIELFILSFQFDRYKGITEEYLKLKTSKKMKL